MKVSWLGTATVLIENNGENILIDPYLATCDEEHFDFSQLDYDKIKGIFITHPHFDHFSDIEHFANITRCNIYTNRRGVNIAKKCGFKSPRFKRVQHGDVINTDQLEIHIYQGRHVRFDGRLKFRTLKRILVCGKRKQIAEYIRLALKYKIGRKDVLGFHIKDKGENIFILGSAELAQTIDYPKDIDCLVIPYQGRSDICERALDIAKRLKPKRVMLHHFDDAFPPISSEIDCCDFKRLLESETNIKVTIPTKGV